MFADLERYKSLERDYLIASTVNQFSGLVYVPDLNYLTLNDEIISATASIDINNATCTIDVRHQGFLTFPAYFIPGYLAEVGELANGVNLNVSSFFELFTTEVLITQISPSYWYPNNYPDASWGRLRQSPFQQSFCFHIGSSKTYAATTDYYQYNESGIFLLNMFEVYRELSTSFNNNTNVKVISSSMTYEPPNTNIPGGIQGLSKNTIINYVKRFPNRLI